LAKKKAISEDGLLTAYMEYVLEGEGERNVYKFSKSVGVPEAEFYQHFGSLESVERRVWDKLIENAINTVTADKRYGEFSHSDKILSLLFTFFENCTLNRSYLLQSMKENPGVKARFDLWGLMRNRFRKHVEHVFAKDEQAVGGRVEKEVKRVQKRGIEEGLWAQLVFLLDFWKNDDSKGFEKTDAAIEKTVKVAINLIDTTPLESILDLGKFLWKERVAKA